jgi:hypothetical protein
LKRVELLGHKAVWSRKALDSVALGPAFFWQLEGTEFGRAVWLMSPT